MPVKTNAAGRKMQGKKNKVKLEQDVKRKNKRIESWNRYVYKILREVHQDDIGITRKSMQIMNEFIDDIIERIAFEASLFSKRYNKKTILSKDIEAAVKLVIPGDLCLHAVSDGNKAISNYYHSVESDK